jgi:ATP-dependent RNA helicase RhlE
MLQRMRERKSGDTANKAPRRNPADQAQPDEMTHDAATAPAREGQGRPPRRRDDRRGRNGAARAGNVGQPPRARSNANPRVDRAPADLDDHEGNERQPGPNAHLGSLRIREPRRRGNAPSGQPDPLRTSIDALGGRGGNRNGRANAKGGRGGPADPLRTTFGRLR